MTEKENAAFIVRYVAFMTVLVLMAMGAMTYHLFQAKTPWLSSVLFIPFAGIVVANYFSLKNLKNTHEKNVCVAIRSR